MFAQVLSQSCVLKHCDFDTVISLSYVDSHTKNIVFDYVESTIKSIKENDYKCAFFPPSLEHNLCCIKSSKRRIAQISCLYFQNFRAPIGVFTELLSVYMTKQQM